MLNQPKDFQILHTHLPLSFATQRLVMRPLELADVADLVTLANNKKLYEVLSRLPHPYTSEDALYFINEIANTSHERTWAITQQHGAFIGVCGIHVKDEQPELGYWLGEPYWRQGFGREAIRALIQQMDMGAPQTDLYARCLQSNIGSRAILEQVGFELTGEIHNCDDHRGASLFTFKRAARHQLAQDAAQ